MNALPSDLLAAFRQDHAALGRGLREVSEHLRSGALRAAKSCAEHIDREAGAHIAFEEQFFYPALRRLIGDAEVDRLYREHARGLSVISVLVALRDAVTPGEAERRAMLQDLELMENHVAECGELFGTMGRIPVEDQKALYQELLALREKAPRWTEVRGKT